MTTAAAQSTSAEAIADDYVKPWNAHDMKAFERLFTEDVRFIRAADAQSNGRVDTLKSFSEIHTTWAKDISIYHYAPKRRSLCSDAAVVACDLGHVDDPRQASDWRGHRDDRYHREEAGCLAHFGGPDHPSFRATVAAIAMPVPNQSLEPTPKAFASGEHLGRSDAHI